MKAIIRIWGLRSKSGSWAPWAQVWPVAQPLIMRGERFPTFPSGIPNCDRFMRAWTNRNMHEGIARRKRCRPHGSRARFSIRRYRYRDAPWRRRCAQCAAAKPRVPRLRRPAGMVADIAGGGPLALRIERDRGAAWRCQRCSRARSRLSDCSHQRNAYRGRKRSLRSWNGSLRDARQGTRSALLRAAAKSTAQNSKITSMNALAAQSRARRMEPWMWSAVLRGPLRPVLQDLYLA